MSIILQFPHKTCAQEVGIIIMHSLAQNMDNASLPVLTVKGGRIFKTRDLLKQATDKMNHELAMIERRKHG